MNDFFSGWNRKLGCVTLILACAFLAAWMRSKSVTDSFRATSPWFGIISIQSHHGSFYYFLRIAADDQFGWEWVQKTSGPDHFARIQGALTTVPYLAIVTPLTVVSACLLLSKPRVSKPQSARYERHRAW